MSVFGWWGAKVSMFESSTTQTCFSGKTYAKNGNSTTSHTHRKYRTQVRRVAEDNGVDVSNQIRELESRAMQVYILFCAHYSEHHRRSPIRNVLQWRYAGLNYSTGG
jgi:hypothetical protein